MSIPIPIPIPFSIPLNPLNPLVLTFPSPCNKSIPYSFLLVLVQCRHLRGVSQSPLITITY